MPAGGCGCCRRCCCCPSVSAHMILTLPPPPLLLLLVRIPFVVVVLSNLTPVCLPLVRRAVPRAPPVAGDVFSDVLVAFGAPAILSARTNILCLVSTTVLLPLCLLKVRGIPFRARVRERSRTKYSIHCALEWLSSVALSMLDVGCWILLCCPRLLLPEKLLTARNSPDGLVGAVVSQCKMQWYPTV